MGRQVSAILQKRKLRLSNKVVKIDKVEPRTKSRSFESSSNLSVISKPSISASGLGIGFKIFAGDSED